MKYTVKDYETRYYAGIEIENGIDITAQTNSISDTWSLLFHQYVDKIKELKEPNQFIGLECYPPNFMEEKVFDYYAMVETKKLVDQVDGITTKKLPRGEYISFEIEFDDIRNEIQKVYAYIREKKIEINHGFDYEEYLNEYNYMESGAKLNFSLLLKNNDW